MEGHYVEYNQLLDNILIVLAELMPLIEGDTLKRLHRTIQQLQINARIQYAPVIKPMASAAAAIIEEVEPHSSAAMLEDSPIKVEEELSALEIQIQVLKDSFEQAKRDNKDKAAYASQLIRLHTEANRLYLLCTMPSSTIKTLHKAITKAAEGLLDIAILTDRLDIAKTLDIFHYHLQKNHLEMALQRNNSTLLNFLFEYGRQVLVYDQPIKLKAVIMFLQYTIVLKTGWLIVWLYSLGIGT